MVTLCFSEQLPYYCTVGFYQMVPFTECTFRGKVLSQQLVLCTSRKRQDVNSCCVCHSSTKSLDLLVLLVGNDGQPEPWKRHITRWERCSSVTDTPAEAHIITYLRQCCSPGPDPGLPPVCCRPCWSGRRSTGPVGARWLIQHCHSRLNYTHTPLSHGQSFWQHMYCFLEGEEVIETCFSVCIGEQYYVWLTSHARVYKHWDNGNLCCVTCREGQFSCEENKGQKNRWWQ